MPLSALNSGLSTAARTVADDGSTTMSRWVLMSDIAARTSSSVTVMMSSRCSDRIPYVKSEREVSRPSQMVFGPVCGMR